MLFETIGMPPGSIPKDWDRKELKPCGAVDANFLASLDLQGDIYPIFHNWVIPDDDGDGEALSLELGQPLLLASRILESVGLPWLSEFCIDDIFSPSYPGRRRRQQQPVEDDDDGDNSGQEQEQTATPEMIVRHHRASWVSPRLARTWLASTAHELRTILPKSVVWKLDSDMFGAFGWVGCTCRHPLAFVGEDEALDQPGVIRAADKAARKQGTGGA
ncbi:hypothetical protein B0H63DRAFT_464936 [Podospora didyma]|uniref:Uncharacterized protein n=1 Tax=Podospora didyma TaxID=330526 RepID=A0AAE0NYY8_9PEZI|nr:hypothetical protein B0H63DRAFT_464936 [Podospora didyma]